MTAGDPRWPLRPIGELAANEPNAITDGPFGSKLKTSHYTSSGPRVIRLANIGDGVFVDAKAHISPEHFATLQKHRVYPGDLVIAALGDNPPRSCIVPEDLGPAIVKADCIRFKPGPMLLPEFANFALNSTFVRHRLKGKIHGVGRPRLNLGEIKQIEIPIPPLTEQQRIVAEIEKQFTRLDVSAASLGAVKANLQRCRTAVLLAAAEGRLISCDYDLDPSFESAIDFRARLLAYRAQHGMRPPASVATNSGVVIPERWTVAALDELLLNVTDGDHQPPPQTAEGVPFVVIGDIRSGRLDLSETRLVSQQYARTVNPLRKPKKGDILYTVVGSFGIAVPVDTDVEFCVQRHIAILRPHDLTPTRFLLHVLNSPVVFRQAAAIATGTAQKTVPLGGLRRIAIPLPPPSDQSAIVAEVERWVSCLDELAHIVNMNSRRSESLRQSILKRAFSGQL